jgi:hypothetical protein
MEVSNMEQFVGKLCKIFVDYSGNQMIYTAIVEQLTPHHITFRDRHGDRYAYRHELVSEMIQIGGKQCSENVNQNQ